MAKGVSAPDERAVLPATTLAPIVRALDAELLRRFAAKPPWGDAFLEAELENVVAPFNERTASPAAVALLRGSRVAVPAGKILRLFLHWCEPEKGGSTTDLDLSVGFYDERWQPAGVCSYYLGKAELWESPLRGPLPRRPRAAQRQRGLRALPRDHRRDDRGG